MSAPVIQIEPSSQYQLCLGCLSPVKWSLVLGTSVPYVTTQIPICPSCAAALLPLVDQVSKDPVSSPLKDPAKPPCTCHVIIWSRPLQESLGVALPVCTWCGGQKE